jgi:hypothetical protein
MLFAYEIGYMRGRSDGTEAAKKLFDEAPRGTEDDSK